MQVNLFGNICIFRLRPILSLLATVSVIITAHMDLLHLSMAQADVVSLICIIIIALNNPVASKIQERK